MFAGLILTSPSQDALRHTVETIVHPWTTARFEILINRSSALKLNQKEKIDLAPYLRRGENTVEVRYSTRDGKASRHQPAILRLERWEGRKKTTPLKIVASEDNPRGTMKVSLFVANR